MADPIVILGFGPQGQMVANMLSSPLAGSSRPYIAFDLEPSRVDASRQAGFLVQYGDGSRSDVLKAAGETGQGARWEARAACSRQPAPMYVDARPQLSSHAWLVRDPLSTALRERSLAKAKEWGRLSSSLSVVRARV